MDKRYKPSSSQEQLEQRMALIAQMEATPGMPLAEAVRMMRTRLRLTQAEFANKLLSPMGLRLGVVRIEKPTSTT
jgi:DNA-binding transcriptional regulator YiaG